MKQLSNLLTLLILLTCGIQVVQGQTSAKDSSTVVEIIYSEKAITEIRDTGVYKLLRGDVRLKQDTLRFRADSATIVDDTEVFAEGNIIIQQGDSLNIFGDSLDYSGVSRQAVLRHDVVLENLNRKLFTDVLYYDLKVKIATYKDGALLTDEEAQLSSKRGRYIVDNDEVYFYDSVLIVHPDFILKTDSLKYNARTNIAYFLGPTLITQNDARIYTESGYYDIDSSKALFDLNPQYKEGTKILTSDSMRYEGRENKTYILGDVDYRNEDKRIKSDILIYDDSTKVADIIGDVDYASNESTMNSEKVKYDTDKDRIITEGRTRIVDGIRELQAENVDFDNVSGRGLANDRVELRDTSDGYSILSDSLLYKRENSSALTSGGRPLVILGKPGQDSVYISAQFLNSYEEIVYDSVKLESDTFRYIIADGDVRILSKDLQGKCDSLVFTSRDSSFRFYDDPVLWADTTQFESDTLIVWMKGGSIRKMRMLEKATVISSGNNVLFDQIAGKKITGSFSNGDIKRIKVDGNANTIYYSRDKNNAYTGLSKSTSSFIHFSFQDGELAGIKYYKDVDSEILPMKGTNHDKHRVQNFSWRIDEKPETLSDLKISSQLYTYFNLGRL